MRTNKFTKIVLICALLYSMMTFFYSLWRISVDVPNEVDFIFIIISFIAILIFSFAFKWHSKHKLNLAIISLSVFFSLYLGEISISLLRSSSNNHLERIEKAKELGIKFDTRTKMEVFKEMKEKGIDMVPTFLPYILIEDNGLEKNGHKIYPLGGVSKKTTLLCNESGEWVSFDSDEHGFNNPTGIFENKIDIALVGDSFTEGHCVKNGDIGYHLRNSGIGALNLGKTGNGPLIEFASLKEYVEPLKPKYVLWIYAEVNDIENLRNEQKSPFLLQYLDNSFSQNLINRQSEIDSVLNEYTTRKGHENKIFKKTIRYTIEKKIAFLQETLMLSQVRRALGFIVPKIIIPDDYPIFTQLLYNAKKLTSSWGGKLYFVYLPSYARYAYKIDKDSLYDRNKVLSIVKDLNIPVIDIHNDVFATHPDPMALFPFRGYGHYNNEGYRLVAKTIHSHLFGTKKKQSLKITNPLTATQLRKDIN